jgi:hypothetical protein
MKDKFVALRIDSQYIEGMVVVNNYCIRGQLKSTLNWMMIEKGFSSKEEAISRMKELNTDGLDMYDSAGYGI